MERLRANNTQQHDNTTTRQQTKTPPHTVPAANKNITTHGVGGYELGHALRSTRRKWRREAREAAPGNGCGARLR